MDNKLKIAWICHFSNKEILEKLPLSKMKVKNFLKAMLGEKTETSYADFAPWVKNLIKEFEKFNALQRIDEGETYNPGSGGSWTGDFYYEDVNGLKKISDGVSQILEYPLEIGKTWVRYVNGPYQVGTDREYSVENIAEVESYGMVETDSGPIEAYKIVVTQTITPSGNESTASAEYWAEGYGLVKYERDVELHRMTIAAGGTQETIIFRSVDEKSITDNNLIF